MRIAIRITAVLAITAGLAACAGQQEEEIVFVDEPVVILPKS